LRELAIPTFVCAGAHDVWSTPAVTQEIVDCLREPRTVTLENVGHLPNLEDHKTSTPSCRALSTRRGLAEDDG